MSDTLRQLKISIIWLLLASKAALRVRALQAPYLVRPLVQRRWAGLFMW